MWLETEITIGNYVFIPEKNPGRQNTQHTAEAEEPSLWCMSRQVVLGQIDGVSPREFLSTWHRETRTMWVQQKTKKEQFSQPRGIQQQKESPAHPGPPKQAESLQAGHKYTQEKPETRANQRPNGKSGISVRAPSGEQNPSRDFRDNGINKENGLNKC